MALVQNYLPGDPHLIDKIVYELKSQGIFDQFRKECIADVDTKPAYQNLRQRVEGSVTGFLNKQIWNPDMNKNQVREMLRKNIYESGFLETGVERIVDQVVNPKINSVFLPKVTSVVYKFLGIERPNNEKDKVQDTKPIYNCDSLLPTDLEAISPESEPTEKKHDNSNDSQDLDDSKMDEDESPPFEPIEEETTYLPPEENSADSHLSGFSGLISHDSNQSAGAPKPIQMEVSNQDSVISKNSSDGHLSIVMSDDNESKMEICEDSRQSKSSKTNDSNSKTFSFSQENSNKSASIKSDKKADTKLDDKSKNDRPKSQDKHKSRHESKSDGKDRKDSKDKRSERDKSDHKDKHSSKDRDKSKSSRDRKDHKSGSKSEKERDSKSDKENKSEKDKDSKVSEKSKEPKSEKPEKYRNSKSDQKSDKDKNKNTSSSRHSSSSSSSRDKSGSRKDSTVSSKEKERNDSNSKEKSKSSNNKDQKDSKSKDDKGKGDSKNHSKYESKSDKHKKDDKHSKNDRHSSSSKGKEKEKKDAKKDKKENKDDHFSSKKHSDRRSTDRDSNDGQSGLKSSSSSFDSYISSQTQSKSQESSNSNTNSNGSGESGTSDALEAEINNLKTPVTILNEAVENIAEILINTEIQTVPTLKLIKPKFASNIYEARRLMKIRKKLNKIEKQNDFELRNSLNNKESYVVQTDFVKAESEQNPNNLVGDSIKTEIIEAPTNSKQKQNNNVKNERKPNILKKDYNTKKPNYGKSPIKVDIPEVKPKEKTPEPISPPLKSSVVSAASWDALEAQFNQHIDYSTYYDDADIPEKIMAPLLNVNIHDCMYFDDIMSSETVRYVKFISDLVNRLDKEIEESSKKHRLLCNNNSNKLAKYDSNNDVENGHKIVTQKAYKRKLVDQSDARNNNKKFNNHHIEVHENFSLPLSPAESDQSTDKKSDISESSDKSVKKDEMKLSVKFKQNMINKGNTRAKRYSSEDLYKPRPLFSGSRRRTDKNSGID